MNREHNRKLEALFDAAMELSSTERAARNQAQSRP